MQRDRDEARRTRLAPSPTGALHLGNARTFAVNWALARQQAWQIVLRIDDLDGPRVKAGADQQAIDVLQWLGLDWDEGPYRQTESLSEYRAALERLIDQRAIYPCSCTRSEIQAAQSAPHAGEHELKYPGTCRPRQGTLFPYDALQQENVAWRLWVPNRELQFHDQWAGLQCGNVSQEVGDFVVANKQGTASYQLAVVVDDAQQGITDIVRGDDLLTSTFRQMWLVDGLQLSPPQHYWHLPLVIGADGRRLAKRHGDSRLVHYRSCGVSPERIWGLIADWCGLGRQPMSAQEFVARFSLDRLPRDPIVFTPQDDAWLLEA